MNVKLSINLLSTCLFHIPATNHQHTNTQNMTQKSCSWRLIFSSIPILSLHSFCIVGMCLTCSVLQYYTDSSYNRNHNHPYAPYKFIFSSERERIISDINIKYVNTSYTWWHSSCTMTMVTSSRYKIEEMLGSSSILCSTKTLSPQFSIAAYGCLGTANRSRNRKNIC